MSFGTENGSICNVPTAPITHHSRLTGAATNTDHLIRTWMDIVPEPIMTDASYLHMSGDSMPCGTSPFQSEDWTTEHALPLFEPGRLSLVSPTDSSLSDDYATSPMTPQNVGTWCSVAPVVVDSKSLTTAHLHYDAALCSQQPDGGNPWMPPGWDLPLLLPAEPHTPVRCSNGGRPDVEHPSFPFIPYPNDPTISRQIFTGQTQTPSRRLSDCVPFGHPNTLVWHKPQTIAPKETFQYLMSSSPMAKIEIASPVRPRVVGRADYSPDSSPFPLPMSHTVPSQSLDNDANVDYRVPKFWPQPVVMKRSSNRLMQRPYGREATASPTCTPRKRSSGFICDSVIPQNSFACTFPDCRDKATGEPKRFKRQEHRKRHEVTVHKRKKKFFCWVPGCSTGFTRTDNLKMHIKNTHGKDSPAQRNRYVATLDSMNKYFDPHWQGELTDDGYPLIKGVTVNHCSAADCEKTFHLEEKLELHLEQHHGKEAAKSRVKYDGECGETRSLSDHGRHRKVKLECV